MIDFVRKSLSNQYGASLGILQNCIKRCDAANWDKPVGQFPFWHVAYHVLFYTDLYLSPNEKAYVKPALCRDKYHLFGRQPRRRTRPFDKAGLLEYARLCKAKAVRSVRNETEESLRGPCGFWWYFIPRLEFHVNNIRHIQHHAGQLSAFLSREQRKGVGWIGSKPIGASRKSKPKKRK